MAALTSLVDELDWLKSFLLPAPAFSSVALGREENVEGSGCDDRGAAGERRDLDGERRAP
jgi:hypothetical protein